MKQVQDLLTYRDNERNSISLFSPFLDIHNCTSRVSLGIPKFILGINFSRV